MPDKTYSELEILEGRPIQDDLIALCEKHNLGNSWGYSPTEVATYLRSTLHALYQVCPKRLGMRKIKRGNDV